MPGRPQTRMRILSQHLSNMKAAFLWLQRKAPLDHGESADAGPYVQAWSLAIRSAKTAVVDLDDLAEQAAQRFGLVRPDALETELVSIGTDVMPLADWCEAAGISADEALAKRAKGWSWADAIFRSTDEDPVGAPPTATPSTNESRDIGEEGEEAG